MPAHYAAPSKGVLTWRPTKIMNMRDLSKDDDFLSHLLVEKLGTGTVPLLVHKMDASRRLPKTDAQDLLQIVRRVRASFLTTLTVNNICRRVHSFFMLCSSLRQRVPFSMYHARPSTSYFCTCSYVHFFSVTLTTLQYCACIHQNASHPILLEAVYPEADQRVRHVCRNSLLSPN